MYLHYETKISRKIFDGLRMRRYEYFSRDPENTICNEKNFEFGCKVGINSVPLMVYTVQNAHSF